MKLYKNPSITNWPALCERPQVSPKDQEKFIQEVFETVQRAGDAAVIHYSAMLDNSSREALKISPNELQEKAALVNDNELKRALLQAGENIRAFHKAAMPGPVSIETMPGVRCAVRPTPIERVGLYIPAGSAPLCSSFLMLAIPAQLAGCKEIVVCTPPQPSGSIDPVIAWLAESMGIREVYAIGGAQAIAAMSIGTEQVPKVDKIFGPGNSWVTAAKAYAQYRGTAIDIAAGPSEVLVIADGSCPSEWIAADLLAQAEHGPDSQVVLCTQTSDFAEAVMEAVDLQLASIPRKELAEKALESSLAVVFDTLSECVAFSNSYGPEHLILAVEAPEELAAQVTQAGSVFLGTQTPESAGDYASGTNHTLPTGGAVRGYSGVNVSSFMRAITFQELTPGGRESLTPIVTALARAEGLEAHARAMEIRQSVTIPKLNV